MRSLSSLNAPLSLSFSHPLVGLISDTTTFKDDHTLPEQYGLGLTNLVSRPSRTSSELSKADYQAGIQVLKEKIQACQPRIVCFVGKGIYEHYVSRRCDTLGLQPLDITGEEEEEKEEGSARPRPRFFVMPSTSGIAAGYSRDEKRGYFLSLRILLDEMEREDA